MTARPIFRRRAILASALAWPLVAVARPSDDPFLLGTSTPGGGFALYGQMLERVLNARAGRTFIRAQPTNGTVENLARLAAGSLDAALIQGTAASEVFEHPDADGLRILFAMYPSPGMLAVRSDSPIARLEDAVGRRVVFGVRTSGLVTLGRQVYAALGIDIDRDLDAIYVATAAESPRIVLSGRAEGLWGAGEGWPGFEALARAPIGARFVGPSPSQIARIVAAYPALQPMAVAAATYPGIERPLPTVGSVNLVLARADLDPRRAAAFVAAMNAAASGLAAALPQAAFSTLRNTIRSAPSPALLHAAVASLA